MFELSTVERIRGWRSVDRNAIARGVENPIAVLIVPNFPVTHGCTSVVVNRSTPVDHNVNRLATYLLRYLTSYP
jgi:hypothetical protein